MGFRYCWLQSGPRWRALSDSPSIWKSWKLMKISYALAMRNAVGLNFCTSGWLWTRISQEPPNFRCGWRIEYCVRLTSDTQKYHTLLAQILHEHYRGRVWTVVLHMTHITAKVVWKPTQLCGLSLWAQDLTHLITKLSLYRLGLAIVLRRTTRTDFFQGSLHQLHAACIKDVSSWPHHASPLWHK